MGNDRRKYSGSTVGIIVVAAAVLMFTLYWAILGIRLDQTIKHHIEDCERHLVDRTTQKCVMTFIPTPR